MNFSFKNTFLPKFSFEDLHSLYPIIIKKYKIPIILAIAGLIFFAYGLISLLSSRTPDDEIEYRPASAVSPTENKSTIVIDVSGAVVSPGVFTLSSNSRVQDGLIKAGGLSSNANREWVAKNLNLAAKLTDGGKIYIPSIGEGTKGVSTTEQVGLVSDLININTASEEELDSLPGIGPVTAGKIIQNRPYSAIEDLLSKKVVTSKVFEKIKGRISIY